MPIEGGQRGRLEPGTILVAKYKGAEHTAEVIVGEEGKVAYRLADGREFKNPSAAGKAVMGGTARNGWRFWSVHGSENPIDRCGCCVQGRCFASRRNRHSGRRGRGSRSPLPNGVLGGIPAGPRDGGLLRTLGVSAANQRLRQQRWGSVADGSRKQGLRRHQRSRRSLRRHGHERVPLVLLSRPGNPAGSVRSAATRWTAKTPRGNRCRAYDFRGLGSVLEIRRILEIAVSDTLGLENSVARSRTLGSLAQTALRALEVGELEARLEAVEATIRPRLEQSRSRR